MLRFMRENRTFQVVIIVFVCVALAAFVLYGLGNAPVNTSGSTIAKVGSAEIRYRDLDMARNRVDSMFQNSQLPPESVRNFVASQAVRNAVLLDAAQKANVVVSTDELRDFVIRSRTAPDGTFVDGESYQRFIQYEYRMQVGTYEDYLQEELLRGSRFASLIYAGTYVPEEKVRKRFKEQNTRVKLEKVSLSAMEVSDQVDLEGDGQLKLFYEDNPNVFVSGDLRQIRFVALRPADHMDQVEVTDEELRAQYDANTARYTRPEQVGASHILIKTDERTDEEALAKAAEIQQALDEGMDFAEAARQFSEGPSAPNGGNLGTFGRGRMVPAFEQAVWGMDVGAVSEPVKSQFGYHIIKKDAYIEGKTDAFEDVKAQIAEELRRTKAMDYLMGQAGQLKAKAEELDDFQAAADEFGYTVETSPYFDNHNNSYLGDALRGKFQVRSAVFQLEELNDITAPINARDMVVVAQWADEKQPEVLPFEENKVRIRGLAEQAAGKIFLQEFMDDLRAKAEAAPDKPLKDFQEDYPWAKANHFTETAFVTAETLPADIDKANVDFMEDIFNQEEGSFLDLPTTNENQVILVRLKEKQEPDMAEFEEQRITNLNALRQEIGLDMETSFLYGQMERYDGDDSLTQKVVTALNPNNR